MDMIEDVVVKAKKLDWNNHVYRTDEQGDIVVRSNGKELLFETTK